MERTSSRASPWKSRQRPPATDLGSSMAAASAVEAVVATAAGVAATEVATVAGVEEATVDSRAGLSRSVWLM